MNTYFARHTYSLDIDENTRRRLWNERRIAIHYPWDNSGNKERDSRSIHPEDYAGGAKRAVRALVTLSHDGGYVCTQHHLYEDCLVGMVKPRTKIEVITGRWGQLNNMEGRPAVLKTLRLMKAKAIKPLDHTVVMVGRPRQGTIMRWRIAGDAIANLVEGRRTKPSLSVLSPRQQEILCSEFLRLPAARKFGLPTLAHLLLPPGKTMRDIDISGVAGDGKMLIAQVTFAPLASVQRKIERLLPYADPKRAHLVLFCDCEVPTQQDGIAIFPLKQAFDSFTATALGRAWWRRAV